MRDARDETLARLTAWGAHVRSDSPRPPEAWRTRVRRRARAWVLPLVLGASGMGLAAVLTLALIRPSPGPGAGPVPREVAGSGRARETPAAMIRDLELLPEPAASVRGTVIRAGNLRSPEMAEAWFHRGG